MAYNANGNYSPYLPQYTPPFHDQLGQLRTQQFQQQMQPSAMQPTGSQIIWVQGEAGAKSWLIAPGSSVLLMDSEAQRFYIKSADPAGMPSLKVYEYREVTGQIERAEPDPVDFVTRKEFEELRNRIEMLSKPHTVYVETKRKARSEGGTVDESSV